MALASVGANKLRSSLTMLGITIGVFSVISVMTAIGAMQASIETGLTLFGSNHLPVRQIPGDGERGRPRLAANTRTGATIDYRQAQRYAELMDGQAAEVCLKVFDGGKQAVYNGVKTTPSLTIVGTNKSFLAANAYTLAYGRNLNDEDVALSRRVVRHRARDRGAPFPARVAHRAGDQSRRPHPDRRRRPRRHAEPLSDKARTTSRVLPITRFFENFGSANRTINIATQSFSQLDYNRTFDRGVGAMRIARGLSAEEPNDFEIYTNDSLKSAFVSIAGVIRIGAFVISTIALLAAGIGIMNIMLVSVTERTKEIGIRKSIGARNRDILRQFLAEAVFISEAGGILGILLGVLGGDLLALWLEVSLIFPFGWAVAGLVVCSAIGIGFGFYPAYRAASLDPIEALRYE